MASNPTSFMNTSAPDDGRLTDESQMPFGKYGPTKGDPRVMADVPASYLLFLWDAGEWQNKWRPVHEYIKENFSALEMDAPDYIVTHRP